MHLLGAPIAAYLWRGRPDLSRPAAWPRLQQAECLDEPLLDPELLRSNLDDLARLNAWLGGTALVARHVLPVVRAAGRGACLTLADVGTGGADIPLTLQRRARQLGICLQLLLCDLRREVLDCARAHIGREQDITLLRCDGLRLPLADRSIDLVTCSLVLHHLDERRAVRLLGELARVARRRVVVTDLERSRTAWLGAWLAAHLLGRSAYTHHDAPLSVRRAFTLSELASLAHQAGLRRARISRAPFFRLALVCDAAEPGGAGEEAGP